MSRKLAVTLTEEQWVRILAVLSAEVKECRRRAHDIKWLAEDSENLSPEAVAAIARTGVKAYRLSQVHELITDRLAAGAHAFADSFGPDGER